MIKSPYTTKTERGAYSANVYKEGDMFIAEDNVGTVLEEGTAAVALQAALDSKRNIFLSEATFDIGSTTLTLQNKDMAIGGEGINSIIKGSADPLIDVTLTNEYQLRMQRVGIHTTSTNKGIYVDHCTGRLPIWLNNVHFVPEGHAGTLLYIFGIASAQVTDCSFQDTNVSTAAIGIYVTADGTKFSQNLYITGTHFFHLNYGIKAYALPAHQAYLAGLNAEGCFFFGIDYPIHFRCVDDIQIIGCMIESQQTGNEKGVILNDCLSARIVGNRLTTRSTSAQVELIGTDLGCYLNTISANYFRSYGSQGDCILLDCSPGNKYVDAIITDNILNDGGSAVQATQYSGGYKPVMIFKGNHVRSCTDNIKGDIDDSIILGNLWGAGCSSTAVNGTYGSSVIDHNHKT